MFMILMLAGDRMSCVWKGMRIRDLLGNALHVFCRLARKHVLRLIASPLLEYHTLAAATASRHL